MEDKVRIDKFLWCVRLFKTRRLANDACVKSKVKINDKTLKSSYHVKIKDKIIKKHINLIYEYTHHLSLYLHPNKSQVHHPTPSII